MMKTKNKYQSTSEQSQSNQPYLTNPSTQKIHYSVFPIWEKVYIDAKLKQKEKDDFLVNLASILLDNHIYLFPKKYKPKPINPYYGILDLENESIILKELPLFCFNPLLDKSTNMVYLFYYDDLYNGDFKYNLIKFDYLKGSFSLVNQKGNPPKVRQEKFISFILNGKIYFFGGIKLFPKDISFNYLYSFNIKEAEWKVENINTTCLSTESISNNDFNYYISNYFNVDICPIAFKSDNEKQQKIILIGGKYFDDSFYCSMNIESKIQNAKESFDIFQITEVNGKLSFEKLKTIQNSKLPLDYTFYNSCSFYHEKNKILYIHNKGSLFSLNLNTLELDLLKPRLFCPFTSNENSMIILNNYIYLIGQFTYYDDCFIFKTNIENLNIKWNFDKLISYENLLGAKECSDFLCSFNNNDKTKEINVNKKIMINFSAGMKKIVNTRAANSTNIFNDINYISIFNILKFIYSNFNENLNKIDIQILNEIIHVLINYKSISLVNIIIDHLNVTKDNAVGFYEIGIKYNLKSLIDKTESFISSNLYSVKMNEGTELKTKLYENYFCEHKVYITCNVVGVDIINANRITVSNEKINEFKELSQDKTLNFCLNCKRVFKAQK